MRAIDGDRLKRKAQKVATEAWKMKIKANVEVILNEFIDWINDAPTIEPERKKGRWIPQNLNKSDGMISTAVYYYPKCSVCGANANYTNFCPNCGAEMTEGEG